MRIIIYDLAWHLIMEYISTALCIDGRIVQCNITFYLFIFLTCIYFTLLREQDEAYINSSRWSTLVRFELTYIRMCVNGSTTVLQTPTSLFLSPTRLCFFSVIWFWCNDIWRYWTLMTLGNITRRAGNSEIHQHTPTSRLCSKRCLLV